MAVNVMARWSLFRDVIRSRKSGSLVVQMGQRYITWVITSGELGWIASTDPEYTFTQFLLNNTILAKSAVTAACSRISEDQSLGALLVRSGAADPAQLQECIARHASWLCHLLLQTTAHVFWSDRTAAQKAEFIVHRGLPFARVLLLCDRSAVETRSAVQFAQDMPERYRVEGWELLPDVLQPLEKRLLPYLKRGASLEEILGDPELDRMTCYRTLFLLWISGKLNPQPPPQAANKELSIATRPFWNRAREIPADWIIPLAAGALLGALLTPSPPAPPASASQPRIERLDQAFEQPAWSTDTDLPDRESEKGGDGE